MRRIVWICGVVIVVALSLVALAYVLVPRERLTTAIAERVSAWTGRDVILSGEPDLDFFPRPTVTLSDVTITGPRSMQDADIISMRRLTGEVRLLPLLIGNVEIGAFTLVEPHISLVRTPAGERNWDFDSGAAALQLAFAGDVPLGSFRVIDGTVDYADRGSGAAEHLDDVDAEIEWESIRTPLSVTGSAVWRGQPVRLRGRADDPFAFINRRDTPVEAEIRSGLVEFSLDGAASGISDPRVSGRLSATMPSLRAFLRWTGSPIGEGGTLGQASIEGDAEFAGGTLSVADADIRLDGNSATGALNLALSGGVPSLSGTLAFGTLDIAPYLPDLRSAMAPGGDWRTVRLDTRWFSSLDSDIRLSAARVETGGPSIGRTAATVSLQDGRLEIGLAEAEVFGGGLSGTIGVASGEGGPAEAEAELRAARLDAAEAGAAFGLSGFSGMAELSADLAAGGATLGDLVAAARGTVIAELAEGTLPGFGIAPVAAAIRAGDPAAIGVPAPVLRVEAADARLRIQSGTAGVESAHLRTGDLVAELTGAVGLDGGTLDLQGVMDLDGVPVPVPFTIGGTLAEPRPALSPIAN